jgi:integrase
MTFPRIYLPNHPKNFERDPLTHQFINIDIPGTEALKNRAMPTEQEIETLLGKADKLKTEFFQLRAKCVIGLVKIFGKRRGELSRLEMTDLTVENGILNITFTILKKHKRGFFQYLEYLKKQGDPELLNKTLPMLREEYENWIKTPEGTREKAPRRLKQTPLSDKYARMILEYFNYMQNNFPQSKFLFPSGYTLFGSNLYAINPAKALGGRQILNVVKELDPSTWTHLYRKLKGSEVARKYGRTLDSAFQVKTTLDLERTETALRYIEDFAPKMETGETA